MTFLFPNTRDLDLISTTWDFVTPTGGRYTTWAIQSILLYFKSAMINYFKPARGSPRVLAAHWKGSWCLLSHPKPRLSPEELTQY